MNTKWHAVIIFGILFFQAGIWSARLAVREREIVRNWEDRINNSYIQMGINTRIDANKYEDFASQYCEILDVPKH